MEQWRDSGYFEWLDNFGEILRIGILVLKMGEGLSIVRISVLRDMEDLKVSILRMMWCLTRCDGVTEIGDN